MLNSQKVLKFLKINNENFDASKVNYKKKGRISTVIVFVVQKDGSLGDFSVSGENKQFNKEALNAIKKLMLNGHQL